MLKVKFSDLALGTKFHYLNGSEEFLKKPFVKIWTDKVAEWDATKITDRWIGQGIFSASDNENLNFYVDVIG